MTDRDALIEQVRRHEGTRLRPYVDTAGKMTIGCGRNLTDVGISEAEALAMLNHDLDGAITDLASFPWFVSLDTIRQRAVIDFRFNVGGGTFRRFQMFIHAMAVGNYVDAANELLQSRWAMQVGYRAKELAAMILDGTA